MRRINNVTAFYTRRDFLSNHYICYFVIKGIRFNCVEQFMMYCKARCFNDLVTAQLILNETDPQRQKLLGRKVTPYDDSVWCNKREGWVLQGMIAKYQQNIVEREYLLATGITILVEASERDTLWGVGIAEHDDRIGNPHEWRGANLCGALNMRAREYLQARL